MTDAELAAFTNLLVEDVARLDPAYRRRLEAMAEKASEVELYAAGRGPMPEGVIVCGPRQITAAGPRWTAKRKAEVLAELDAEPDRSAEIMDRHGLSAEELVAWRLAFDAQGYAGLAALKPRPATTQAPRVPRSYSCTSGRPEGSCGCYACHGG